MYHWHPLMPDMFNISGTVYTVKDFMFRPDLVVKHGMKDFMEGLLNQRAGAVSMKTIKHFPPVHGNPYLLSSAYLLF